MIINASSVGGSSVKPWHSVVRTWRVGDGGVEAAEVNESVGAEEEVGDDGRDRVQLR